MFHGNGFKPAPGIISHDPGNRTIHLNQSRPQFKSLWVKVLYAFHLHDNVALTLNDMEILGAKRFNLKGFELGATSS